MQLKLAAARDTAFSDRIFDVLFDLSFISELAYADEIFIDGAETDRVIDLGSISKPLLIFIKAESKYDGGGGTTEDDPATVQFKIGSGTIFDCSHIMLLANKDDNDDQLTNDIKITTLANTDTKVKVLVVGEKD